MPFDEYDWINKNQLLSFEEIARLAGLFVDFGVRKLRLTGGEPLVRRDLPSLVHKLDNLHSTSYATFGRLRTLT